MHGKELQDGHVMETRRKTIDATVPPELLERCWKRGHEIVVGYDEKKWERSRLVGGTGNRKIDNNVEFQSMSRVCECAGAMAMGLDPRAVIKWTDGPDPGWDFIFEKIKIDVKGSWSGSSLIWPRSKNHLLEGHRADVLMMVWTAKKKALNYGQSIAHGWVTKENFIRYKLTAPKNHFLDEGTYYMPAENLCWMDDWFEPVDI